MMLLIVDSDPENLFFAKSVLILKLYDFVNLFWKSGHEEVGCIAFLSEHYPS